MRLFFGRYWKSIGWALVIGYLLFLPGNDLPHNKFLDSIPHLDKIVHFILFTTFCFLLHFERKVVAKKLTGKDFIVLTAIAILYGGITETIQLLIPERSCSWGDLLTDLTGITAGILIFKLSEKIIDRYYLPTP